MITSATAVKIHVSAEEFFQEVDQIKGFVNDGTLDMKDKISTQEAYLEAVKARAEIAALEVKQKTKDMDREVKDSQQRAENIARHVSHIVRTMYNMVMRSLDIAGIVIDRVFQAFISLMFSVIGIVMKIALAKTATVWLAAEAAQSMISAAMLFAEAASAEREKQAAKQNMDALKKIYTVVSL
jgi:hypothetical protein